MLGKGSRKFSTLPVDVRTAFSGVAVGGAIGAVAGIGLGLHEVFGTQTVNAADLLHYLKTYPVLGVAALTLATGTIGATLGATLSRFDPV